MGVVQTKAVKDQAVAFNLGLTALAVLTAAATFAISLIPPGNWLVGIRILAGCLAVATAVVGFFKFRNERAFKRQQQEERVSLDQALKAESRRTSLLINGAMLGTADKLRRLSVLDQASKDVEISGFRTSIVSKVCDLVQSEAPRAAYFRVQDLSAQSRVMQSGTYSDSRNREDSFTSEFVEGYGGDQGVWDLIDSGGVESSNDTNAGFPPHGTSLGIGSTGRSCRSLFARTDSVLGCGQPTRSKLTGSRTLISHPSRCWHTCLPPPKQRR